MKIHKYENLYPRTFWIANLDEGDPTKLLNRFTFFVNEPGWNRVKKDMEEELDSAYTAAIAACYPVEEKTTKKLGVLLVVFNMDSMDTDIIAHESVHVADYFYEVTGCNTEDFTEGNEAYAYLVGWTAGCIANALIKENNEKTE